VFTGNFSIVKECTNRETGERFAVKCINKAALNPKDRSNLVQEIEILKDVRSVDSSFATSHG
jgi:serine/threonine protein kinase